MSNLTSFQKNGSSLKDKAVSFERPLEMGQGEVTIAGKSTPFSYEVKKFSDNSASLEIDHSSPSGRVFSALGSVISSLLRKPAIGMAAAAISVGAAVESSKGALIPAGGNDSQYKAFGDQHNHNLLWVQADYQGYTLRYSAIRINDQYAITAGHGVYSTVGYANVQAVGTGMNYITDPGQVRSIAEVKVYPTYSGGNNDFSQPDIAILKFSQPLNGTNLTLASPGSISVGEVVTSAGFGVPGRADQGFTPEDGNVRGWNALTLRTNPLNVNSAFYWSTSFAPAPSVPMNGRGTGGDSGSLVLDSFGSLVGMTDGASPSTGYDSIGSTQFLDLTNPVVSSWIQANTVVPEPSSIATIALGGAALLSRRRRTKSA